MFEITSKDIGTFEVTGKFFGVSMEKVELVFQVNVHPVSFSLFVIYPYEIGLVAATV